MVNNNQKFRFNFLATSIKLAFSVMYSDILIREGE